MLQKKKENQGQLNKKEVAKLLEKEKGELARIKTEQIIRDDYMIEVLEIMEVYFNLLVSRFGLIEATKVCDPGITEAVCTIMWATPYLQSEISEMKAVSVFLASRYGKEFAQDTMENKSGTVSERVIKKLQVSTPSSQIVEAYIQAIAKTYNIPYLEPLEPLPDSLVGGGFGAEMFPDAPTGFGPPPSNGSGGGGGGGMPMPPGPVSYQAGPSSFDPSASNTSSGSQLDGLFPPAPSSYPQQTYPPQNQEPLIDLYPPEKPSNEPMPATAPPAAPLDNSVPPMSYLDSAPPPVSYMEVPPSPPKPAQETEDKAAPPGYGSVDDKPVAPQDSMPSPPLDGDSFPMPPGGASVGAASSTIGEESNVPDFDELLNRFHALKSDEDGGK